MDMPKEIQEAKDAYYQAYDKIRDLVRANKQKYVGTKYEDCEPLIKEQWQFFVRQADLEITRQRLEKQYNQPIPKHWAYWVVWHEKIL